MNLQSPKRLLDSYHSDLRAYRSEIVDYGCKCSISDLKSLLIEIREQWAISDKERDTWNAHMMEVSRLQQAVSDLQIMLLNERNEKLNLSQEVEQMQTKVCGLKKTLDALLNFAGISKEDLPRILSERRKLNIKISSKDDDFNNVPVKDAETLLLENKLLKEHLTKLKQIYKGEMEILMKDRELIAEEKIIETSRWRKQCMVVERKLAQSQKQLLETNEKLISLQEMLDNLKGEKTVDGRYSTFKSKELHEQMANSVRMAAVYKELAQDMEREMELWKDKAQTNEQQFKIRTDKMLADVVLMKNRYEELDRRRLCEAAGFRQDIKFLREKLTDLEKKFAKVKSDNEAASATLAAENDVRATSKLTVKKARILEQELLNLKRKFSNIEL